MIDIKKPVILLFDLESMPNLVRTWRKWEQNVIWYERYGYIWSISWKYRGSKKVYHKNITDFPLYKKDKYSDKALVEFIWKLVDEADICIAHNGNAFDLKMITGRFIHYRLEPPRPYKKIDTKLLYKMYLNEDSNSLKDICLKHNLPHKLETGGEKLWELCEQGDKKSINKMRIYNNGDVIALEAAYDLVLPYITNHPNIALMNGDKCACPNCGSKDVIKRGFNYSRTGKSQAWQCKSCGSWSSSPIKDNTQIR
jgi:predicted RNA-binding Zn-ribbon protein involved in translation (DUF1610 family)